MAPNSLRNTIIILTVSGTVPVLVDDFELHCEQILGIQVDLMQR
jgi:hypothetical protein